MIDSAVMAALAALAGSVVGGLSSFATTWVGQRYQGRRERMARLIERRELLYAEFIEQAASAFMDAIEAEDPDPGRVIEIFKLTARIRLAASDPVIAAADRVARDVVVAYNAPPMPSREVFRRVNEEVGDPLLDFTAACRIERDTEAGQY